MCRLLVYAGSTPVSLAHLLVLPSHSITKQSYSCRERMTDGLSGLPPALNADGFGVGWYDDRHTAGLSEGSCSIAASPCMPVSVSNVPSTGASGYKRTRTSFEAGDSSACVDKAGVKCGVPLGPAAVEALLDPVARPGVYSSTSPAWNDVNLPRLCDKLSSRLIFAHVRASSLGSGVHIMNCHPFTSSRYMFMHNGHIAGFTQLRRRILMSLSDRALAAIRGTTDSEHLFAMFLTQVELLEESPHAQLTPAQLQSCLLKCMSELDTWRREAGIVESSLLNLCVTDGATVLATRLVLGTGKPASLYFTSGSRWAPRKDTASSGGSCSGANSSVVPQGADYTMEQADRREHAVIIASERLTASSDDWLCVPPDTLLVVHPSMAILQVPIVLKRLVPMPTPVSNCVSASPAHVLCGSISASAGGVGSYRSALPPVLWGSPPLTGMREPTVDTGSGSGSVLGGRTSSLASPGAASASGGETVSLAGTGVEHLELGETQCFTHTTPPAAWVEGGVRDTGVVTVRGTGGIYMRGEGGDATSSHSTSTTIMQPSSDKAQVANSQVSSRNPRLQMSCAGRDLHAPAMHTSSSCDGTVSPAWHSLTQFTYPNPPPRGAGVTVAGSTSATARVGEGSPCIGDESSTVGAMSGSLCESGYVPVAEEPYPAVCVDGAAELLRARREADAGKERTADSMCATTAPVASHSVINSGTKLSSRCHGHRPPGLSLASNAHTFSHQDKHSNMDDDTFSNNTPSVWNPCLQATRTMTTGGTRLSSTTAGSALVYWGDV